MQKIESHAELSEIIRMGEGYVLNVRNDRKMLHAASCEALEVMSTRAYDKWFFDDWREAKKMARREVRPQWLGSVRSMPLKGKPSDD